MWLSRELAFSARQGVRRRRQRVILQASDVWWVLTREPPASAVVSSSCLHRKGGGEGVRVMFGAARVIVPSEQQGNIEYIKRHQYTIGRKHPKRHPNRLSHSLTSSPPRPHQQAVVQLYTRHQAYCIQLPAPFRPSAAPRHHHRFTTSSLLRVEKWFFFYFSPLASRDASPQLHRPGKLYDEFARDRRR